MRVVTDVVTGKVDPGACVWCRERAVNCGIAVCGYGVGGRKRPRKEGAEGPRKKPMYGIHVMLRGYCICNCLNEAPKGKFC